MSEGTKLYYRIGEVSAKTALRPSVLRFWETEFPQLSPLKSSTGQRLYSQRDLELVSEIKRLLYQEKLTIDGARKKLSARRGERREEHAGQVEEYRKMLSEVRNDLVKLRNMI